MSLRVVRLDPRAVLPSAQRDGDAGLDLALLESVVLSPGGRVLGRTGLAIELEQGTCGLVLPRSGLAIHDGVTLANAPGLIDAGYRGEVQVALLNLGSARVELPAGARVAQLLIVRFEPVEVTEVAELTPSHRGEGGFGHTGL